jgi:hypothetical protein
MVAPLQPKPLRIEIAEARDHVHDRPGAVGSWRQQRRSRAHVTRRPSHCRHAARRALGFTSRRILIESSVTSAEWTAALFSAAGLLSTR